MKAINLDVRLLLLLLLFFFLTPVIKHLTNCRFLFRGRFYDFFKENKYNVNAEHAIRISAPS